MSGFCKKCLEKDEEIARLHACLDEDHNTTAYLRGVADGRAQAQTDRSSMAERAAHNSRGCGFDSRRSDQIYDAVSPAREVSFVDKMIRRAQENKTVCILVLAALLSGCAASAPADFRRVNDTLNAIPYRADIGDHWATPEEFMAKGGDCEDYAIAKADKLAQLGHTDSRLAIVRLKSTGQAHAVLLADADGKTWVLDNIIKKVVPLADAERKYNFLGTWTESAGYQLWAGKQ